MDLIAKVQHLLYWSFAIAIQALLWTSALRTYFTPFVFGVKQKVPLHVCKCIGLHMQYVLLA